MARVLGRIRLSRLTDETTSPERQREIITTWASQNDHEVIGWAEDLDVSGGVDPFDTPSLGPWLAEDRLPEWDILCAWKLDRLARRAIPLHRLFGLCIDHDKTLICVADNIDLSHWVGRLVASVIAGVAEGELEAIRERTRASHRKLRELGRWPGGRPAYGYRAVEREDAAGWQLVQDPESFRVLERVVQSVLDGKSVQSVAKQLTDDGVLSPADYVRHRAGKSVKGGAWRSQTLLKMLRSKTLLGYVTHDGVTVRDDKGMPVCKGPALLSQEDFDRLQSELESRSFKTTRTNRVSPLTGVIRCADCGGPMHHRGQTFNKKLYRYYYCREGHGSQIKADWLEELLEEKFLSDFGESPVEERVYIPAENHQIELDQARSAIDEISTLLGTITSDTVRSRLLGQISALDSRITQLEQQPAREAGWTTRTTDKTYREQWESSDTEQRRQLLIKSGITAKAFKPSGTKTLVFFLETKKSPTPS